MGRCDCLGGLKHDTCKHVDGLQALLRCTAFDLGDFPVRVPHPRPSEEEYRLALGQAPMYWSVKVEQRHDSSWCLSGVYHFDHQRVEASTAADLLALMRLADAEREQKKAAAASVREERGYNLMRVAGAPDDRHEVKQFGVATGAFALHRPGEATWRLFRTVRGRAVELPSRANDLSEVIGLLFPPRVCVCTKQAATPVPAPNPPAPAGWWLSPATRMSDGSEEISVRFGDQGAGGRLHRRLSSPEWRVLVGWGPEARELGTITDPADAIVKYSDRFANWLPRGGRQSNFAGD